MASVNEARMPLLDHLRELRKRVLRSAIAVLVAFGGGWYFYDSIIVTLAKPVCDLKAAQQSGAASCGALYISGVLGPLDLPIFLLTFNLIGFLRGKTILKPWRIWIFTIFFFVAALSPTADPLSMVLLSGPLILFYFMAGLIAVVVDRRRDKKAISVETGSAGIEAPTSIKE